MSNWADGGGLAPAVYGFDLVAMSGTLVASSGDAFEPTTWVELVASTPFEIGQVDIYITHHAETEFSGRFWLGVGSAGNERSVMSLIPYATGGSSTYRCSVPISIPRGSRIAIKQHNINGTTATEYFWVRVWPRQWSRPAPPTRWTATYTGPVWAYGTSITNGDNVYGAWAEMTASAPFPVRYLGRLAAGTGGGGNRNQSAYQVGAGGAGSERLLWDFGPISSAFWGASSGSYIITTPIATLPAGTRLATRGAGMSAGSSTTNLIIGG
jgi:hypothetical protein